MRKFVIAAPALAAACGSAVPAPEPPSLPVQETQAISPESLNGRWLITALDEAPPAPTETWSDGEEPLSIVFTVYEPAIAEGPTHLGGYNGCNMYFGAFQLSGGHLMTDAVGSTARRCGVDTPSDRQEQRLMAILFGDPAIAFAPDGSLMVGPPEAPALRAVRQGAPFPLLSDIIGSWRITEVTGAPPAPSLSGDPLADAPILRFSANSEGAEPDPEVSGYTGCNSFNGPMRLEGGRLAAGQLIQTEIGCGAVLGPQEDAILSALQGGHPVVLTPDRRMDIGPEGAPILRAVRVAD